MESLSLPDSAKRRSTQYFGKYRRFRDRALWRDLPIKGLKWSIEVISENGDVLVIVEPPGRNTTL
jgi:hypothetical protein